MRNGRPGREFEVKLEIPGETVSHVMRMPWLWELASGELCASQLRSIYYDTPDRALRDRGVTLRIRHAGTKCVQTMKASANGALAVVRDEWEEEIVGEHPNLKLAGAPLKGLSRKRVQRGLRPCFEVHIDRSAFPIQSANSTIEIAIDRSHIVSESSSSFCELELELKRGAASEMARIARRIASEVPASLSLRSKAERGFALLHEDAARPCFGERIEIRGASRVGEAFQQIAWSCLRHFALNKDAVEKGDARAVRQMREGLHRLSMAMTVFRRLLDGPETDAVKAELVWLIGELNPACELDQFIEATLSPLRTNDPGEIALNALAEEGVAHLDAALMRARDAVASDRYREFVLRTALWVIAAEWSDASTLPYEHPSRRVGPFAARALGAQIKKLSAAFHDFASIPSNRHVELHDAVLRLQTTIEFFQSALPGRKSDRRALMNLLHRLKRDLNRLVDIDVAERLRDEFMRGWTASSKAGASEKAFAMGFVLGLQALEKEACTQAVARTSRRLRDYRAALGSA